MLITEYPYSAEKMSNTFLIVAGVIKMKTIKKIAECLSNLQIHSTIIKVEMFRLVLALLKYLSHFNREHHSIIKGLHLADLR